MEVEGVVCVLLNDLEDLDCLGNDLDVCGELWAEEVACACYLRADTIT